MKVTKSTGINSFTFSSLRELLAKASPSRSGDQLAGIAASSSEERVAAQMALADLPLDHFLHEDVVSYDDDEITRLIAASHNKKAFSTVSSLTVGEFRNWILSDSTTGEDLANVSSGLTPEMVAAVSKIMRNQDLIIGASKITNITGFRTTVGFPGTLAVRLQPNDPVDDLQGIAASIIDGLFYGCGDAVIGINPATDNYETVTGIIRMLDDIRLRYSIPTQSCVLTHITTTIKAIERGLPVDLVFQSIGGTEAVNKSFGISISTLAEGYEAGLSLHRGTVGNNVMYFETGQGSALSANAHHGVDQQTIETRAYALARQFNPFLVNTVVGFIGPEYLYDGKQIIRAGLEDHFCGKIMGLPMGVDVCYTNHSEADQNDMDILLTLLGSAGVNFVMGIPGADDIMLNYQSTSFHDALYIRRLLGLSPSPEFENWLSEMKIMSHGTSLCDVQNTHQLIGGSLQ